MADTPRIASNLLPTQLTTVQIHEPWVSRDGDGDLYFWEAEPLWDVGKQEWFVEGPGWELDGSLLPDLLPGDRRRVNATISITT